MSDSLPPHGLPPGSSVHGILQARILVWVTILFSRGIFLTQGLNSGLQHNWWPIIGLSFWREIHTGPEPETSPWHPEGIAIWRVREKVCYYVMLKELSDITIPLPTYWVFQNTSMPIILSFEVHPGNCHCWYTGTLRCACYPCLHSPESSLSMHPWHHSTPCNKLQCPLILLFMIFKYWIFMETLQKMRRYFK